MAASAAAPSTCITSKAPAAAMRLICSRSILGQRHPVLDQSHQSVHRTCAGGRRADDDALPPDELQSPKDVAFAEARIRAQTMVAEDFLHDMGAISIFGDRHPGNGAPGRERRQMLAARQRHERPAAGRLPEETTDRADNERIKRYVAKLTLNPAIAVGIDDHVGFFSRGARRYCALAPCIVRHQAMDGHQKRLCSVVRDG